MKKTVFLFSSIIILGFASCKKDRTCECTNISDGFSSTSSITIKKIRKGEAKTLCQNKTNTYSSSNANNTSTYVSNCSLK